MKPDWYTIHADHTGAWLVLLGHDPALYAPEDWRSPADRRPLGAGTWGLRHGITLRFGAGCLLAQSPMWLTDLEARARVWVSERRAARAARRERARARHIERNTKENR
ncbi:MAG: hypothetical protein ACI39C_07365 [Dietzia sp.]